MLSEAPLPELLYSLFGIVAARGPYVKESRSDARIVRSRFPRTPSGYRGPSGPCSLRAEKTEKSFDRSRGRGNLAASGPLCTVRAAAVGAVDAAGDSAARWAPRRAQPRQTVAQHEPTAKTRRARPEGQALAGRGPRNFVPGVSQQTTSVCCFLCWYGFRERGRSTVRSARQESGPREARESPHPMGANTPSLGHLEGPLPYLAQPLEHILSINPARLRQITR